MTPGGRVEYGLDVHTGLGLKNSGSYVLWKWQQCSKQGHRGVPPKRHYAIYGHRNNLFFHFQAATAFVYPCELNLRPIGLCVPVLSSDHVLLQHLINRCDVEMYM